MMILGVDPGKRRDPAAIAVLEVQTKAVGDLLVDWYKVIGLAELDLGLDHVSVVEKVKGVYQNIKVEDPRLVVDATGVGEPVIDMMRREKMNPVPIGITGGEQWNNRPGGGYNVPKKDIAVKLAVTFETGRIKLLKGLRYSDKLIQQLQMFTAKHKNPDSDNVSFEAEKGHDDLVLAIAIAIWWYEHCYPWKRPRVTEKQVEWNPLTHGLT